MDEHQFLILAKKFSHHGSALEPHDVTECMVCEALAIIEAGQYEVGAINTELTSDPEGYRGDQ